MITTQRPVISARWSLATLLPMLVFCVNLAAANDSLQGLDRFVEQAMDTTGVPAVAVSVVKGDRRVLARGYGTRTLGTQQAVDADTLFAIGSVSKHFAAALLGTLVAEDRLHWDDRLAQRLPGFQVADALVTRELTVRDALTHRSGLLAFDLPWRGYPHRSRQQVLEAIRSLPQAAGLRERYIYNNNLYIAAGEVVPQITGKSWDRLLRERLFEPLGMQRSNSSVAELKRYANVATPHAMPDGQLEPVDYANMDNAAAAGGINSTASDMAQWCRLLIGNGEVDGRRILAAQTLVEMLRPQMLMPADRHERAVYTPMGAPAFGAVHSSYGLGLERQDYRDTTLVYRHAGGIDGMYSAFAFFPREELCVTVLTNASEVTDIGFHLVDWIAAAYLGIDNRPIIDVVKQTHARDLKRQRQQQRQQRAEQIKGTDPSLPLERYLGSYSDPVIGTFTISRNGDGLSFVMGDAIRGDVHHWHYDTFRIHWCNRNQRSWMGDLQLQFLLDDRREAVSTINLLQGGEVLSNFTRAVGQ